MIQLNLAFFVFGILCCVTPSLNSCIEEKRISGEVFSNKRECIDIHVPPNKFLRLNILQLSLYYSDCANNKLEIIIIDSEDKYTFCQGHSYRNFITAVTDVRVYFQASYSSFKLYFTIRDIECLRNSSFHCSNHSCIPINEVCDGVKDCENGADEVGCETGILSIKGVTEARSSEITWIKSKRSSSWGWHENTPRVLFSLFLSGGAKFDGTLYEEELMAKQTELKTSISLLKNPLSAEQLSMFINSLLVTCHNPRQFYGQNLIKRLKEQVQSTTNFTHPIAYLTLCNAKEPWPLKAIAALNKILNTDADYPFVRDYQAFAVMAVSCYENQTKLLNKVEYSSLKTNYENVIQLFKETQLSDGSFGNLHTTSLITQALISSGQEYEKDWKLNATVQYLLEQLSSPHDVVSSSLTLPVLNAKSISDISKVNCTLNPRRNGYDSTENGRTSLPFPGFEPRTFLTQEGRRMPIISNYNQASKANDYTGPKMRVRFSLYVGDEKDVIHTISLRVPENYTAYEVMKLAETEDPKYTFIYKKISGMMYVYQIDKTINDPERGYFWMLYQGRETDNATLNHYNLSPDQLVMQDKEHLVMWYKKAHF
ncbi:uncharacterized protein CG3556 isoform X2 [Parasteatoda tepidariorum]|uniref:uncharacterized protein CG3556 isoform X2 n=1 Tax=Parasteatoda tepidariorum TaxID=114398 RepID=UPI001C725D8A|nr:uncharacterized protein CG3556-like isoform X4 [Parasteatoda tepidariorum]